MNLKVRTEGRDVFVEDYDDQLYGAASLVSVLSLPIVLEQLVPKLAAVDGNTATSAQSTSPVTKKLSLSAVTRRSLEVGVRVMEWLAVLFLFLFLCALLDAVLPRSRPSRLHRWLQPSIDRLGRRLRRRRIAAADPFDTLRVQTRLSHLAGEIRRIETTPRIYARAHRLKAAEAAYDDLLDEACRLAGVPSEADLERSEEKRWLEERELASRGWSW